MEPKNKNSKLVLSIIIIVLAVIAVVLVLRMPKRSAMPSNPAPQGGITSQKLNMNAVCESALTYMTFPDGASADAFVAECKEGKHPEVIEHYKAQMSVGDSARI